MSAALSRQCVPVRERPRPVAWAVSPTDDADGGERTATSSGRCWVKCVAQAIANKVETEDRQQEGDSGETSSISATPSSSRLSCCVYYNVLSSTTHCQ